MILDSMLGRIQGLDILQEAGQLDHEVRIIMISGYKSLADPSRLGQTDDLPQRAKALNAGGVLPTPWLIQQILSGVKRWTPRQRRGR